MKIKWDNTCKMKYIIGTEWMMVPFLFPFPFLFKLPTHGFPQTNLTANLWISFILKYHLCLFIPPYSVNKGPLQFLKIQIISVHLFRPQITKWKMWYARSSKSTIFMTKITALQKQKTGKCLWLTNIHLFIKTNSQVQKSL